MLSDSAEIESAVEEDYCCALCPTPNNDGTFAIDPLLDLPICGECSNALYKALVYPECSRRPVIDLYPAVLREVMARTGLSFYECRRIYLEDVITSLVRDWEDDEEGERVVISPDGNFMSIAEAIETLRQKQKKWRQKSPIK